MFLICSSLVGGPVPQEGGGLGRARILQDPKVPLVPQLRGSAGVRGGDGGQEERFCFVLVELFTCQACKTRQKMQNSLFVEHFVKYLPLKPKQVHPC